MLAVANSEVGTWPPGKVHKHDIQIWPDDDETVQTFSDIEKLKRLDAMRRLRQPWTNED